jgi:D-serine deaminase-like pyridoxal phosphate-dependent protein
MIYSTDSKYSFLKEAFKNIEMPFAFIDWSNFEKNIQSVIQRANGKKIRLASKSIRSIEVMRRIFSSHDLFQGIMAYHPGEAVFLSKSGFDDILMGYPVYSKKYIQLILDEVKRGKSIVFMIDSIEHIQAIQDVAGEMNITAEICIDLDMSTRFPFLHFGVHRSPLNTPEQAVDLYHKIKQFKNVQLAGIMGYEAQIAGVGDANSSGIFKNMAVRLMKQYSARQLAVRREKTVEALMKEGANLRIVNGGGTGSLETTHQENCVNEVTVGSAFFSPGLFDHYLNFHHYPAAGFALEITRQPKTNIFTCHGGGYVASGEVGLLKQPIPYLPESIKPIPLEGFGEVQTPILYEGTLDLKVGDPLFFRHAKAGELGEHFNEYNILETSGRVSKVKTYRGEGYSFS